MEFDLDKALEEVPIHVEDPPPPPTPSQASDRMSAYGGELPPPPTSPDAGLIDLPPVELRTLENCTKNRPKPKRRMKPSRPHVSVSQETAFYGLFWFESA